MQQRIVGRLRRWLIAGTVVLSFASTAQEPPRKATERKAFAGSMAPERRHSLLDSWKAQRAARSSALLAVPQAVGGTAIVGRPSMVINSSNSIVYTRQYLGEENNCDVSPSDVSRWTASTAYLAGDHASTFTRHMMAMNSGTSGAVTPSCGATGSTVVDGTITWLCSTVGWTASTTFTAGMVIETIPSVGFLYQAQNTGLTGATQPLWPTDPGATVVDNGVTWKAIGSPQGTFRGCNPMEMAVRASGGGETVVASEGEPVGDSDVFGWSEHLDMNSSGIVAFKAALSGYLSDNDEYGTGIFTAGPGAGSVTKIVASGDIAGGRFLCGFSSLVAINDAGQIVADAYGIFGNEWQPSTAYPLNTIIMPVTQNGRRYRAIAAGTTGAAEPTWPTAIGATVVDGTITWRMEEAGSCDDTDHALIRYTPGTGTELLVEPGMVIAGSSVTTLGCTNCVDSYYDQFDGRINESGNVPVVLSLADGTEGVYIFTGPGTATEVARTSVSVLARTPRTNAITFDVLEPRTTINDNDQVLFSGFSGGVESIFRYTPPGTIVIVASAGDDVGTRTGGPASGVTITSLGNYFDLNNSGNAVFMAELSSAEEAYFFWNGTTGVLSEIHREPDTNSLAPELISLNDSDVAAYVTGADGYDFDVQEGPQFGGVFFWRNGTSTPVIAVGDVIGGDTVTGLYAQHHSFARRQFSSSSCVAVAYAVNGDDVEMDCSAGDTGCYTESPLIFTACAIAGPALTTTASASVPVGGSISDTAQLSGGANPTGTITFDLYGPNDATCSGASVFTSTVPVAGNGSYPSASFTANAAGTYRWIASYSGDVNNGAVSGSCNDANESVVVTQASPAIATTATPTATVGGTISDSATLSAGFNPTGTITFNLYGPGDAPCSAAAVFTATVPVAGNGTYGSGNYPPTAPGTYRWIASYSGDANNAPIAGACGDANESSVVTAATPAIATTATATAAVGTAISDAATLSGGFNPTGTITFNLYGPGDATCSAAAVFTSTVPVAGNGNYPSASFTPTATGTYRWIASYSGDANNSPAAGACGDANESTTVTPASPILTTIASPGVVLGGSVSDSATLAGGFNPTGSITFNLYGPNDATCSTVPVFTSSAPVAGNGSYGSGPFTPLLPGTYRWVASYSGDANNNAAANACNDPNESVVVSSPALASPTLTTTASPGVAIGNPISDSGTLAGGNAPTGTITFTAFGPNDAVCSGTPAFTATVPVAGNGPYNSGPFTPTLAGTYRFVAAYSGDANNNPASSPCNAPNESVVVSPAGPSLVTAASGSVAVGGAVSDTATLSGGASPGGTITFNLFGPNDATCAGTAVFTSVVPVTGNGSYASGPYVATAPGTYRWTAVYSGDANNVSASSPCNAPNESVVVTPAAPVLTTTASPGVPLGGSVSDTATLAGGFNPGGTITFTLFGPDDAACSGAAVFTSVVNVAGNGSYPSNSFTPTATGTYRWVAVYSGDANNSSATSPCGAPNESVVVTPPSGIASPTLVTVASPGIRIGGTIHDTATLSGGNAPTGTITFNAYGPIDSQCTGTPAFTASVAVSGNGTYTSPSFRPTAAGIYNFVASYSGDANNNPALSPCGAPNESVPVTRATPAITTTASPSVPLGGTIRDTAVLSGGFSPRGTIIFSVFGPDNPTCAGVAAFTSSSRVNGNGTYQSAEFLPTAPGTYRFVARYLGDVNNQSAVSPCNAPNESVVVTPAVPTLGVAASPSVALGGTISGTATLNGGFVLGGTITFNVFGPDNASCSGTPRFTSTVPVSGNGSYGSGPFTPTELGTYRFVAVYSGDANNTPAITPCGASATTVEVTCGPAAAPILSIVGEATTGRAYALTWTASPGARAYVVEEATDENFTDTTSQTVEGTSVSFRHETGQPKAWFYRVTPIAACDGATGQRSDVARIVIVPLPPADRPDVNVNIPFGSTDIIVQQIFIAGFPGQTFNFTATVDQPWLSVTPQSGTFTPAGVTFDVAADPASLPNGTHSGTLIVTLTDIVTGRIRPNATTIVMTTVSVNLVTPVTNLPSSAPQANSIIIPSLGHLQGATARWQSDIRMLNAAATRQTYQVIFTAASQQGSGMSKTTLITADPGQTIALDDVVRNWFGLGSLDDRTSGYLEIRPPSPSLPRAIASSRTYSLIPGAKGTLGQFIPALSFNDFIGRAAANALPTILSMQQIAQSDAFRTNVGVVEAAGKAGTALLSVFNTSGAKLLELPVSLAANEQKQLNNLLAQHGIALDDGRIEVQMTSGDGKVTAYASVIDNRSGVPLLVSGVPLGATRSSRYVVPGVADLNTGAASWRTDMRVFNSDATARTATLVFYPQNGGEPVSREVTIAPREVKTLDDVVTSIFGQNDVGGAVHVTTAEDSSLIVTGRTYNVTAGGTLGQFIPAVTPAEAVGRGERSLQILQAEDSPRYRTNLGLAEVTGRPVTIEVTVTLPDAKATPTVTFELQPNEFRQFRVLHDFGLGNAYNARISVRAIGGDGRVTAYGSVIDLTTESPTYIPAQ
jgi:hypothetical protein